MSHGDYILYEKAKRCFGDYVFATHRMAPDLVRFGAEYERERAKVLVKELDEAIRVCDAAIDDINSNRTKEDETVFMLNSFRTHADKELKKYRSGE